MPYKQINQRPSHQISITKQHPTCASTNKTNTKITLMHAGAGCDSASTAAASSVYNNDLTPFEFVMFANFSPVPVPASQSSQLYPALCGPQPPSRISPK